MQITRRRQLQLDEKRGYVKAGTLKDDLAAPPEGRDEVSADTRTLAEKFADAAREHGADQDEDAFKGVLRKLAKPK